MSLQIKSLIDTFSNPSRKTPAKDEAAIALQKMGAAAVDPLIDALETKILHAETDAELDQKNREETRQLYAARVLGRIGKAAATAAPRLADLFAKSSKTALQKEAAIALSKVGMVMDQGINNDVVFLMVNVLNSVRDNWNEDVREAAAIALGEFGHGVRQAALTLIFCLRDRSDRVRNASARALVRVGRVAVPALVETLKFREQIRAAREQLANAEFGTLITQFINAVGPDSFGFQREAATANLVWSMRERREEQERVEQVFTAAVGVLSQIGMNAAESRVVLQEIADADRNPELRAKAIATLLNLGKGDENQHLRTKVGEDLWKV
jgi:HEAT repeat protein